jgi:membrane protein
MEQGQPFRRLRETPHRKARRALRLLGRRARIEFVPRATKRPAASPLANHARRAVEKKLKKKAFIREIERITLATIYEPLRDSIRALIAGDLVSRGAALSFYTLFAIAPLFVVVLAVAGPVFGRDASQRELFAQLSGLVGSDGAEAVQGLVNAARKAETGYMAATIALATLLAGASGAFVQLQNALNSIWGVRRKPGRGARYFLKDRLLSFGLVVGIGFLLLVSLVLSAGLAALGRSIFGLMPGRETLWQGISSAISFGVITILFAMIFKLLPDVKIAWRDVWIGAIITATLFNVGKLLFGLCVGRSSLPVAYGAAGSLVILLLWVYYSAQILLVGAKFTQIYSGRHGLVSRPAARAEKERLKAGAEPGALLYEKERNSCDKPDNTRHGS